MKKNLIYIIILCSALLHTTPQSSFLSNEKFITGEDGVIRMYVNIMGNVKHPGTYLVFDGIDFLSVLSVAGGYLQGSNLDEIIIYRNDGEKIEISLENYFENSNSKERFKLKPRDTIYIEQKKISRLLTSTNFPSIMLSILNIVLTIEKND